MTGEIADNRGLGVRWIGGGGKRPGLEVQRGQMRGDVMGEFVDVGGVDDSNFGRAIVVFGRS